MTPQEAAKFIEEKNTQTVDLKSDDPPGLWQRFSMPLSELAEMGDLAKSMWAEGVGFEGSSVRGYQKVEVAGP